MQRRSLGAILRYLFACFLVAAVLQPLWSRPAGGYAAGLAGVSRRLLPLLEPAPIFGGFTRSGTQLAITSDLFPGKPLGAIDTRYFSFYLPFVVLLLGVARWRFRLVSVPEIVMILAFLFTVQATCLSLGALRLVVLSLVPTGGPALIGPVEYSVMHTIFHTYCSFGPQLWSGVVVALVLFRNGLLSGRAFMPAPRPAVASPHLAAACAVLILPSLAYMTLAPVVRRLTGQASSALVATARQYARAGDVQAAARLARDVLDSNGQDVRAMLLLGSLEEQTRPERAVALYEGVLSLDAAQVPALMGLARAKTSIGDGTAAEHLFYTALKISPQNYEAYELLGDLYMARRKYETARAPYDLAVRFGPDRPGSLLKLGRAHQLAGDPCAAGGFYARSLELNPDPELRSAALELVREVTPLCPRASR